MGTSVPRSILVHDWRANSVPNKVHTGVERGIRDAHNSSSTSFLRFFGSLREWFDQNKFFHLSLSLTDLRRGFESQLYTFYSAACQARKLFRLTWLVLFSENASLWPFFNLFFTVYRNWSTFSFLRRIFRFRVKFGFVYYFLWSDMKNMHE